MVITEEQRKEIIRRQAHIEFLNRVLIAGAVLLVIAFMATMLYSIYLSQMQRDKILSCTTPSGKCFKENSKRTAGVVTEIVEANRNNSGLTRQVAVYAAYCSKQPENKTIDQVEGCVKKLLKTEGDSFDYQSKQEATKEGPR